jgi:hypothetical protein
VYIDERHQFPVGGFPLVSGSSVSSVREPLWTRVDTRRAEALPAVEYRISSLGVERRASNTLYLPVAKSTFAHSSVLLFSRLQGGWSGLVESKSLNETSLDGMPRASAAVVTE